MKRTSTAYNPAAAAEYWRGTKDEMFEGLADSIEGSVDHPDEEHLTEFLTFLCVFAMGYSEMGLMELSDRYKKRTTIFSIGLARMGFQPGKFKGYVMNRMCDGFHDRVVKSASQRASYRMCDIERYIKQPKKEQEETKNVKRNNK